MQCNSGSKGQTVSVLDGIKGVGEVTRESLVKHFKSVKRIREATLEELASVVGAAKARVVFDGLRDIESK